jgi:hypothetical protein
MRGASLAVAVRGRADPVPVSCRDNQVGMRWYKASSFPISPHRASYGTRKRNAVEHQLMMPQGTRARDGTRVLLPQRKTQEEHIRYACQVRTRNWTWMPWYRNAVPQLTGFRDGRGDRDAAPAGCSSCRLRSASPVAFVLYPFRG